MRTKQARCLKGSISHATTTATLGVLVWLLLTLPPGREVCGQGTVIFANLCPGGTTHIWGPSTNNLAQSLTGLGSNDNPSGTTPFAASGMALIGANGMSGQFGSATTFAQLLGAAGSNQPEYALGPVGQCTTFRSQRAAAGLLAQVTDTLTGNPAIPGDAPAATFEIVAWDNSSGLYPTWAQAGWAWQAGIIAAGRSAPFTVANIGAGPGGGANPPPYLNNSQGGAYGVTSFNLFYSLSLFSAVVNTLPPTDVTAHSATLNGTVQCYVSTTAGFQWGTTPTYGDATPPTVVSGCCCCPNPFSASLTGLQPGTTYYFRAGANNTAGPAQGSGEAFTTLTPSPSIILNTGNGYWGPGISALSYAGNAGSAQRFILLQSTDPTASLSVWTRVATNNGIPGSFPIPPVGTEGPKYYRVKGE